MKLNERIKNSILDTTIVRCEVENDDSTQHYYDSIIQSLKIDNFPLISVNTIEKKTYIVECEGLFFLVFDHYLIECMHLLNQCILNENQLKSVELFFFKSASEECYVQCNLSSAVKFASKYMNRLNDVVSIYLTEEFSKSIPNYLFIQQAFLIAHEVFHFYVHKNPNKQIKGMIAKESFLQRIYDYTKKKNENVAFYMLDVIRDKNMIEECLCDSTAVIQAMDVAEKTGKLSIVESGIAIVLALMNQYTISVIQDTIKFSGNIFYERIQNLYNFRLLHLKEFISLYFKDYVSNEKCSQYQKQVEEIHDMWLKKVMKPIMNMLVEYNSLLKKESKNEKKKVNTKEVKELLKKIYLT